MEASYRTHASENEREKNEGGLWRVAAGQIINKSLPLANCYFLAREIGERFQLIDKLTFLLFDTSLNNGWAEEGR